VGQGAAVSRTKIFQGVAAGDKASLTLIFSASAHPGPWVAARRMNLDIFAYVKRQSSHAQGHGFALGKCMRSADFKLPPTNEASKASKRGSVFIEGVSIQNSLVQAYDVAQGDGWNDGLSKMMQAADLNKHVPALVARELEGNALEVTPTGPNRGRGLATLKGKREGDVLLNASALFYAW